jgi:hypothetical protein
MNEEPTYVFKRGVGWVPEVEETVSGIIGKYHVTLVKRQPEVGEFYWTDQCSLAQTLRNLENGYVSAFNSDDPHAVSYFPIWHGAGTVFGKLSETVRVMLLTRVL